VVTVGTEADAEGGAEQQVVSGDGVLDRGLHRRQVRAGVLGHGDGAVRQDGAPEAHERDRHVAAPQLHPQG